MRGNNLKIELTQRKGFHVEESNGSIDLICGMELDTLMTDFQVVHKGKIYYFCSKNCSGHFQNNPEMYLPE